jgi:DnaJ-class molecular chaperone
MIALEPPILATVSSGTKQEYSRTECTPCRGAGKLISGKGGTPHEVTCPWCGGDGRFHPGRDAQTGEAIETAPAD